MELRLGATLILDEAEVARLVEELPRGWSDPVYDALARAEPCDPWEVATLFDITIRDALDEAVAESWIPSPSHRDMPIGENWELIETALERIWGAYPETDVTIGNIDDGPLPSGWEIERGDRDAPDEGVVRVVDKLAAAGLWAETLATKPAMSGTRAHETWLKPDAPMHRGDASGIPEASAEVALTRLLRLLRDVFELTYPRAERSAGHPDLTRPMRTEEMSDDA